MLSDRWAVLVEPFDAEALGRAVVEMWRNPARCREMGVLAHQEAKRYRWDGLARAQDEFYQEVIATHNI